MVWPIRSRIRSLYRSTAGLVSSSLHGDTSWCLPSSGPTNYSVPMPFLGFQMKWAKTSGSHLAASLPSIEEKQTEISSNCLQDHNGLDTGSMVEINGGQDLFGLMKQRFLSFKKHKYMKELEHFQALAEAQFPKFMVIACADSRVCPSNILGFQPGEVLMIRNVANLVPPLKNGPSECNAALQFAVNTLKVENILVIGHSSCAGVETLMNMQENVDSSNLITKWVVNAKVAKWRTKAVAAHLSFNQQCRLCEKESINQSLLNLLTYPWIEDKVRKDLVSLHGGYYDFSNCSFEKWTLDFGGCNAGGGGGGGGNYALKDQELWC